MVLKRKRTGQAKGARPITDVGTSEGALRRGEIFNDILRLINPTGSSR